MMSEPTDRKYWETKASKETVALVDEILEITRDETSDIELKYNKFYIGVMTKDLPPTTWCFDRKETRLLKYGYHETTRPP